MTSSATLGFFRLVWAAMFAHRFDKFIWLVRQQDKFGLGKLKNVISI